MKITKKLVIPLFLGLGFIVGCSSPFKSGKSLSYIDDPAYACSKQFNENNSWYYQGVPYPCSTDLKSNNITSATEREIYHDMMMRAWVEGDLTVLDEYIVKDSYDYSPLHPPEKGTKGFAGIITAFRASLSDIKLEHSDMAEGDLVTHFWKLTGFHTKSPLFGVQPTGKEIVFSGISTVRVKNGKVDARWSQLDIYGLLVQLGLSPKIL